MAVVAIVLLEWTVRTFERCLGRMPDPRAPDADCGKCPVQQTTRDTESEILERVIEPENARLSSEAG